MPKPTMVLVQIDCQEIVHYSAIRYIPADEVAEFEKAVKAKREAQYFQDFAETYVRRDTHFVDGDGFQHIEMQRVIEEKPKPVREMVYGRCPGSY